MPVFRISPDAPPRRRRAARGFSLVEVVVAMAVLILGAYGVYHQFLEAGKTARMRQRMVEAEMLAHREYAHLRAAGHDALAAWTPPAEPQTLGDDLRYQCRTTLAARPGGALELAVQVGWNVAARQPMDAGNSITVAGVIGP